MGNGFCTAVRERAAATQKEGAVLVLLYLRRAAMMSMLNHTTACNIGEVRTTVSCPCPYHVQHVHVSGGLTVVVSRVWTALFRVACSQFGREVRRTAR